MQCACAYYIVICCLSGCTIFFLIIPRTARFSVRKKRKLRYDFSLQLLSDTFLILRRIELDTYYHKCRQALLVNYRLFLSDFSESWMFWTDFREIPNTKFYENPSCESRAVSFGHTNRAKLVVAFSNFANTSKNDFTYMRWNNWDTSKNAVSLTCDKLM